MAHRLDKSAPDAVWDLVPLKSLLPEWQAHSDQLHGSTTQRPAWVSLWQEHVNQDCICFTARRGGRLALVLTLEVIRQGPLKIAIFPGGQHANENFAATSKQFDTSSPSACLAQLKAIIKEKRPDIDAVYLHRQIEKLNGLSNPLLSAASSAQTDIALSFALNEDFQMVLEARDGTKKQKKIRKAGRKLDERGGWKFEIANNAVDVQAALDQFFQLKAHRLAGKGISNVFASRQVQNFFLELFSQSVQHGDAEFEMHTLKVAGQIMAVTGNSRLDGRLNVEFTAVDDTEPSVSHGEFLYFHMIGNACARNISTFSFGVGDEPFKRSWCNIETLQFNCALGLTWKGAIAVALDNAKTRAKRYIKAHRGLYSFLKLTRKSVRKVSDR